MFRGCLSEDDYFAYNPTNMQLEDIHRALLIFKWSFACSIVYFVYEAFGMSLSGLSSLISKSPKTFKMIMLLA